MYSLYSIYFCHENDQRLHSIIMTSTLWIQIQQVGLGNAIRRVLTRFPESEKVFRIKEQSRNKVTFSYNNIRLNQVDYDEFIEQVRLANDDKYNIE